MSSCVRAVWTCTEAGSLIRAQPLAFEVEIGHREEPETSTRRASTVRMPGASLHLLPYVIGYRLVLDRRRLRIGYLVPHEAQEKGGPRNS
jgi:hypothetical protein